MMFSLGYFPFPTTGERARVRGRASASQINKAALRSAPHPAFQATFSPLAKRRVPGALK
jgi:hypothetical protein